MARRKQPAVESKFIRLASWSGLNEGDPVVVDSERDKRGKFTFVAYVENKATGDHWIEVRGGKPGEAKTRSFTLDQIYPADARKSGKLVKPSLVEAPRLPL
jgi:hypothetical protein